MCKLINIFIGIVVTLNVSAYCLNQNPMANGEYPYIGSCAVDKINGQRIPFGTKIRIIDQSVGIHELVVTDRFGGNYNNRMDIFMASESECWQFGRRWLECRVEMP